MKKLTALCLSLLLILSLVACTGDNSPSSTLPQSGSEVSSTASSQGDAGVEKHFNLYTWEGMFPQDVLNDFTEETGIKVNYVNYDYGETMLTKLETENGGTYDLVITDDYIIEKVIEKNLARKLDKEKLTNFGSINPLYQGQFFDPADEYTVPYGAGVQTIVYNPDTVDIDIKGYADLWDESLRDNVGLIENFRVIDGMALKVLGESYNTSDVKTIERAGEKLLELAPNIRLIKDDNIQDDLISGEVAVAVMYTSMVTTAKLANPDLKVVFPNEGLGFGIMAKFIPVNAPNPDEAHAFIDYILRPEVSAKCYEFLGYYCTNKDADELIAEEYREFLTLPADFTIENMEMIENISAEAEEAHNKVWTAFRTAAGQ